MILSNKTSPVNDSPDSPDSPKPEEDSSIVLTSEKIEKIKKLEYEFRIELEEEVTINTWFYNTCYIYDIFTFPENYEVAGSLLIFHHSLSSYSEIDEDLIDSFFLNCLGEAYCGPCGSDIYYDYGRYLFLPFLDIFPDILSFQSDYFQPDNINREVIEDWIKSAELNENISDNTEILSDSEILSMVEPLLEKVVEALEQQQQQLAECMNCECIGCDALQKIHYEYNISYTSFDITPVIQKKSFLNIFTENFQFYSFKFIHYMIYDSIYKDDVDIYHRVYIMNKLVPSQLNLILAIIFDKVYFLTMLNLPLFNYFLKNTFEFSQINSLLINNPEYYYLLETVEWKFFSKFFSHLHPSVLMFNIEESFLLPVFHILQILMLFFLVLIFTMLYFTYFNTLAREDNITDHDFLAVNVTLEAEEEIGSMDDMILASVILVFLFFWFFWIDSWIHFSNYNNFAITIFLFPFLYYIIFFIPTNLLYDYGNYFLPYLNGVSKSAIILVELLFDYIALSIFFLRLIVQNVRLLFMIFTYSELHELVIFYKFNPNFIIGNESLVNAWQTLKNSQNSKSYSFFLTFFNNSLKWLYELFHTFFMIIFQFIAFFAMVFWLFLFLYTMFVIEKQEGYFFELKLNRIQYYKKIINYKNNLNTLINENVEHLFTSFSLNSSHLYNDKFKLNQKLKSVVI